MPEGTVLKGKGVSAGGGLSFCSGGMGGFKESCKDGRR